MVSGTTKEQLGRIYVCDVCGLGYKSGDTAEACETYCTEHNACSLEITQKAVWPPRGTAE